MKVVKEGPSFVKPWQGEFTCKKCESILLLGPDDVKVKKQNASNDWGNYSTTYLTWTCVMCESINYIADEERRRFFKENPKIKEY